MRTIRVGSRKSKLALVQSGLVIESLSSKSDQFTFAIQHIVTKGDRILDVTLSKIGGKGLFVKEIERALLDGTIDFAVHSMKDMPAELPDGLEISSIPLRENPHDVLLSRGHKKLEELEPGAVVGTSSLRRAAQILQARPDLTIRPLRGNVDTRMARLNSGDFDAIILAAAGMNRLGVTEKGEDLPFHTMLPAVGQGALAIECRSEDAELKALLNTINHEETAVTVRAERSFLKRLNGSCQVPIAAYCERQNDGKLSLSGLIASPDGTKVLKTHCSGEKPELIGITAAEELLDQGAGEILSELGLESDSDA
ncbi:hydroxymethylbilane synthase [Sporolactobacillus kofuensis]|uniref:Porphobilinogen deaminase n=1 Tax=Sporolactobacillus kofuensis TaxID=269672 RepID=A0ABW1WHF7_9BACL|nr:hydroxymethylbilane synthase [Sporolactobacillus kofuensis]MCO7176117.1 hydroxymethylbilane synthase [Sporolactobacillus kofuensis]